MAGFYIEGTRQNFKHNLINYVFLFSSTIIYIYIYISFSSLKKLRKRKTRKIMS
jgi:hypothetical protein